LQYSSKKGGERQSGAVKPESGYKTVAIRQIRANGRSPSNNRGERLIVHHDPLTNANCHIVARGFVSFPYFLFYEVGSITTGICLLLPYTSIPLLPSYTENQCSVNDSLDMLNLDYSLFRINISAWILLIGLTSAQVQRVPKAHRSLDIRNENIHINTGDSPTDRTIFTMLSLFCMTVLSFLLGEGALTLDRARLTLCIGSRFTRLRKYAVLKRNIMYMLVLVLYFIVMAFIVCSAVMVAGQGLYTRALCTGGTWICLIFYTFAKGIMYVR
jgi:hypothetical protein